MELIPNLQTSPVGSSIWLSSAYLPGAIVFVSRFYLTRAPIAGAGRSADDSEFPARAETWNWGFGGTAGLRAISEETDRLSRDTGMRGRFKTPEHNPCARSRGSNHLNEPRYRGSTRLPWQGKSPRVYPWRDKQRSDRPPVLASLVRPRPRRADLSFRRLSCQRKRKNLQTETSCARRCAELPGWGDAVRILDPLATSPTIFNERIDHFNGGSPRSWPGVGVF